MCALRVHPTRELISLLCLLHHIGLISVKIISSVDFIKNIGTLECTLKETFDVVIILNFGHFLVL